MPEAVVTQVGYMVALVEVSSVMAVTDEVSVSDTIASVIELAGSDKVPPADKVNPVANIPVPDIFKLPVCGVPGVPACSNRYLKSA